MLGWLCYGECTQACPLHDYSSFHNGIVLSQLWKNICFSFERPSSCYSRVGSIPSIISYILRCLHCGARVCVHLCNTVLLLKMVSVLVLQIKSKRHRKSLKTPKAHRKVSDIFLQDFAWKLNAFCLLYVWKYVFVELFSYLATGCLKGTNLIKWGFFF